MQCMKCGREVEPDQTFCQECLDEMDKHPVRPGTVVLLPRRPGQVPVKKAPAKRKRPVLSPEEHIAKLKRWVAVLSLLLLLSLGISGVLGYFVAKDYIRDANAQLPGQNYSSGPNSWAQGAR